MNYRNQRGVDNYMISYNQMYLEDMHNNYVKESSQYVNEGGNFQNGIFINPKQLYWIKKRKIRRELLDSIMVHQNNNYMHESRHRHAMKRLRAPSGRFLTKEEMAEYKKQKNEEKN